MNKAPDILESSPPGSSLRDAGLAFVGGARRGMSETELSSWCRRNLVGRGCLRLRAPAGDRFTIVEPGAGKLQVATADEPARLTGDDALADRIARLARRRAVDVLSLLLDSPPDDRFLHAAIQSGRVARTRIRGDRSAHWTPALSEGDSLSYMVVTLFAADALEARDDYDQRLRICRECGDVAFDAQEVGRGGCTEHGARSLRRRRDVEPAPLPLPSPTSKTSGVRRHDVSSRTEPAFAAVEKKRIDEP